MSKRRNKLIILLFICFIGIGYAILSSNLSLNNTVTIKENKWDINFKNEEILDYTINNPSISIENKTVTIGGTFDKPGDYLEFSFNVVNEGTIDAVVDEISSSLTEDESKYINYSLTYYEDEQTVEKYDNLRAQQSRRIKGRIEYKYDINNLISLNDLNITFNIIFKQPESLVKKVWNYEYVGKEQEFIVPQTGTYKFELWGGNVKGSTEFADTAKYGAYTSGEINLKKNDKLYIYVGEGGKILGGMIKTFNGGGGAATGTYETRYISSFQGGGATDIRLVGGNWSDFNSLKSRIMVAAGAGQGSAGGGLSSKNTVPQSNIDNVSPYYCTGATQTSGGTSNFSDALNGKFGIGADGENFIHCYGSNGGGGGYYGGAGSISRNWNATGDRHGSGTATGGSSYISGHNGCNSISSSSTETNIIHTENSKHYSGYYFVNTVMIDGDGYVWTNEKSKEPSTLPNYNISGKTMYAWPNGYARITLLK